MAKAYAKRFYNSKAWQRCRAAFIMGRTSIDGGICQRCKDKPGYIVDHIVEISESNINDTDIILNHDNMQYLCLECHNRKTFSKHKATEDGVMFNEEGDLIAADSPHKI